MTALKQIGIVLILPAIMLASCKKIDLPDGTPKCVKKKIKKLRKDDCPSVETVYQYSFQGQTVYVFNPKNCGADLTSEVINDNCETVCWLGGNTGSTTCNGVDFYKEASGEKLLWEND